MTAKFVAPPAPMTDAEFRMALTKAMNLGQYRALPYEKLLAAVRTRQASHIRLQKLATTLGLEVPKPDESQGTCP